MCLVPEPMLRIKQGQPWKSAIAGHDINPVQAENEKQRLLLERFQEEVRVTFCLRISSSHAVILI